MTSTRTVSEPTSEAAPAGPLSRVGLALAYDGGGFHGFAPQPGQRTVSGALAAALEPFGLVGALTCAGRTDAGVHASAQIVHADLLDASLERLAPSRLEFGTELHGLVRALSARLGGEIVVYRARVMDQGFDARRSALSRRYRYRIATGVSNPLERRTTWNVAEPLELAAMRIAADALIGEHDFAAFCRRPADRPEASLTRRVLDVRLVVPERETIEFEIEANAFCHQMVRSIVGLLVAVGEGRVAANEVINRLRSKSRVGAPTLAPAQGLTLVAVTFPERYFGTWCFG